MRLRPNLLALIVLASASTARAAPPPRRAPPRCDLHHEAPAGTSLWLASNPHLPLVESDAGGLSRPAPKEACKNPERWGAPGRSYRVLDRWGQVRGEATVTRRERYRLSGCDEIMLGAPDDGAHLLVASDGAWQPGPSFEDRPSASQKAAFKRFVSGLDERLVRGKPFLKEPAAERLAYFRIGAPGCQPDSLDEAIVGSYAVATGTYIVIAKYDAKFGWKAVYLSPIPAQNGQYQEVALRAIVDLEGDGWPEVVVHSAEDTAFWDAVLHMHPVDRAWTEVVRSASGGTL